MHTLNRRCAALVLSLVMMLCWISCQDSGFAVAPAPATRPIGDKWAVVIGISNFRDSSVPGLKFAAKDAEDFYNYLISPTGGQFKQDHVKLLLNEAATSANIWDVLGGSFLPYAAAPDDLVVVYISTHGSPSDVDIRGANYIVANDTKLSKLFATGVNMNRLLDTMKERVSSGRMLLVLDTCYSGAGAPTGQKGFIRQNFDSTALSQGLGSLVICSSSPNQRSWESDKLKNSYFTSHLIKELQRQGSTVDIKTLFEQLKQNVQTDVLREKGQMQTPMLSGSFSGPMLVLGKPPTISRDAPQWSPEGQQVNVVEKNVAPPPTQQQDSILMSDSFDRPDADKNSLGEADLALGGKLSMGYMPTFPSFTQVPQPIGASIYAGTLMNNGKDYGGVQFRPFTAQDLNMRMDVLVPTDQSGHISLAGPYFRSRWANPGDGILGGASSGFWVRLHSTGQVSVKRLNPCTVVAMSRKPASFDSSAFHKIECAVSGSSLQVMLDNKPVEFQTDTGPTTTFSLPDTAGHNDGCAGVCFAAEDNRGQIGGQRVDNIIVTKYRPLISR